MTMFYKGEWVEYRGAAWVVIEDHGRQLTIRRLVVNAQGGDAVTIKVAKSKVKARNT